MLTPRVVRAVAPTNSDSRDSRVATVEADRLVALAEFGGDSVRRSLNLEKAYLQGRFGAIPQVDQADVRTAVGLALQAT